MVDYVSLDYFKSNGGKIPNGLSDEEVENILKLSSMACNAYCTGYIGEDLTKWPLRAQEYVKLAVIYQTNAILEAGEDAISGTSDNDAISSYQALDVTVTYDLESKKSAPSLTTLSNTAKRFLETSGFVWRGLKKM